MIITLDYKRIQLTASMPGKYEGYRLPGTRLLAWEGRSGNLLVQEVRVGSVNLLYLVVLLTEQIPLHIHLPQREVVFAFGVKGDWVVKCFGKQEIPLSSSMYNLFLGTSIQLSRADTIHTVYSMLLLETGADILWNYCHQLKGDSMPIARFEEPMQAGPAMIEAAMQLVQSSYFPEPRYFHHDAVKCIFTEACKDWMTKKDQRIIGWSLEETNAMELVRQYIHDYIDTDLSLETLSRYGGMNREQLRQGFKSKFGKTVFQYRLQKRLDDAKMLLAGSHQTLKEIAGKSGYRNVSNFTTAFKRYTGQTPAAFRKQKRRENKA